MKCVESLMRVNRPWSVGWGGSLCQDEENAWGRKVGGEF